MKFNYAESYPGADNYKWMEFDTFLEWLSEENPEEFAKELYTSKRFMAVGVNSSKGSIIYVPSEAIPEHIERQIRNKLVELWPIKG